MNPDDIKKFSADFYAEREKKFGLEVTRQIEKAIYLRTIDMLWIEHLTTMDELRTGIGLQGYGQRDPLVEYKQRAYAMFESLLKNIESSLVRTIFKVNVEVQKPQPQVRPLQYSEPDADRLGEIEAPVQNSNVVEKLMADSEQSKNGVTTRIIDKSKSVFDRMKESAASGPASQVISRKKVGRNDPCPCGSGKKYKKCHGR